MMFTKDRRSRRLPTRPVLETLEQLALLSGNVLQTNLVSDLPGVAQVTDPNLVNPWGISESGGSPFWISDNNAGVSTLYNAPAATPSTITINPLVVSIPAPGAPLGKDGTPTGTVFNIAPSGFTVTGVNKSGAPATAKAVFLFVTEDGTIVGWNPGVNPVGFDPTKAGTYGIIAVDNSGNNFTESDPHKQTGAVYKGMAIANSPTAGIPIFASDPASTSVVYAANFRSGQIEVYNTKFEPVVGLPSSAFSDPSIPNDYAPFNVQVLNNLVYVTYAKQNSTRHDDDAGPHRGFVDVFNLNGTPAGPGGSPRLVTRGALDSPWGLAIAPSSFGDLSGDLLVGNFGNGMIDVYNPATGDFLGNLKDADGEPIQIDGLWALKVGNGANGGSNNVVYFTAGLFDESHGLFGSLTPVAAGTAEGDAEKRMVTAFQDVFTLAVQTLNADVAAGASRSQIVQDAKAVDAALEDYVHAEIHYLLDTQADMGGGSLIDHHND